MPVERGYGPPDADNKIEEKLESDCLSLKIRSIGNNEGVYSLTGLQNDSLGELGQMIISCANAYGRKARAASWRVQGISV